MIQVLNKNSVTVPHDIIEAAVNAYEQGEQQDVYNLGTFEAHEVSNDIAHNPEPDFKPPGL